MDNEKDRQNEFRLLKKTKDTTIKEKEVLIDNVLRLGKRMKSEKDMPSTEKIYKPKKVATIYENQGLMKQTPKDQDQKKNELEELFKLWKTSLEHQNKDNAWSLYKEMEESNEQGMLTLENINCYPNGQGPNPNPQGAQPGGICIGIALGQMDEVWIFSR